MNATKNIAPEGHSVLSPYLVVENVEDEMKFLEEVFDAKIRESFKRSDGIVHHGEVIIGDTTVMIGKSSPEFPSYQAINYVYVEDTDQTHKKASYKGAVEIAPPADKFYGVRESGFSDKYGNQWWIAQVIQSLSAEELQKKAAEI